MPRMPTAIALTLGLSCTSCLPFAFAAAVIEGDDVRLEMPGMVEQTRAASENKRGHVHALATATAEDINAWVAAMVEGAASVVRHLDGQPASDRDGAVRIYGPHADADGRDLAWLVRLDGNALGSTYELWVGTADAASQDDMHLLLSGELAVEGALRSGGFFLDFDVVEKYPQMKPYETAFFTYAGAVQVTFERDTDTERKTIDIDFQEAEVHYDGFLDEDVFTSDETYAYVRDEQGGGSFHLALFGEWDEWMWSGPERERMVLDMAWTGEGAGRTRGQVLEVDGVGDLKYGDVIVHECFGADGYLTWREINDPYLAIDPDYNLGDEATCTLGEADLPS